MGLFLQIIERSGPIPWDDLTLPEGRTKKACSVMVDREKQNVKKAREAAAGGGVLPMPPKKVSAANFSWLEVDES